MLIYQKATFSLPVGEDDDMLFTGYYHEGENWNLFAIPAFEEAEMLRIITNSNEGSLLFKDGILYYMEESDSATGRVSIEEAEKIEAQIIQTPDGEKTVWNMGFGWVWEKSNTQILRSVGSVIDENCNVSPLRASGAVDYDNETHISAISQDWLNALSQEDRQIIAAIQKNQTSEN